MMVEDGLTQAGAAQAAGLGRARVAAVLKILDLPEDAQTLVGEGVISLTAVDALLAVGAASTTLLDATIAHIVKHPRDSGELARNPGWFISRSVASTRAAKAFAIGVGRLSAHDLQRIALGKKVEALFAEVETLERKVLSYAHAHVEITLDDVEVDQARAAGVLLELGNHTLITDRDLYRELLLAAMTRKKETLTAQLAVKERATAKDDGKPAVSPEEAAERTRRAVLRAAGDDAHGVNLDIGASLTRGLAEVDPADMNVARFFVLCRRPHRANYVDRAAMPTGFLGLLELQARVGLMPCHVCGGDSWELLSDGRLRCVMSRLVDVVPAGPPGIYATPIYRTCGATKARPAISNPPRRAAPEPSPAAAIAREMAAETMATHRARIEGPPLDEGLASYAPRHDDPRWRRGASGAAPTPSTCSQMEQRVEARRGMASLNPKVNGPALAMALHDLALARANAGLIGEAHIAIQDALTVAQRLAAKDPVSHQALVTTIDTLSRKLASFR